MINPRGPYSIEELLNQKYMDAQANPADMSTGPKPSSISMTNATPRGALDMNGSVNTNANVKSQNRKEYLSPQELMAHYQAAAEANPLVQEQRSDIDIQKKLLAMQASEGANQSHVNYAPLAALADAWNASGGQKTNLAASITAPENSTDKLASQFSNMRKEKSDVSKQIQEGVKNLVSGSDTTKQDLINKLMTGMAAPGAARAQNFDTTNYHKWNQMVNGQLKKDDEALQGMAQIREEIASGNPIDSSRIATLRAKVDAGGRPNIAEVQMETGDPALVEKYKAALTKLATGDMTGHNRALYLKSLDDVYEVMQKYRSMKSSRLSEMGSYYRGVTPEMRKATLPDAYVNMPVKPAEAGIKKPEDMTEAELDAYLAKGKK